MMKLLNDHHIKQVIKKNLVYIILFFVSGFILALLVLVQIPSYLDFRKQIADLKTEVAGLETKKTVIYSFDVTQLGSLISTLNTLLPPKEDYFSIITSLSRIAKETGFKITGYTVGFDKKTPEKVSLNVEGEGTGKSLLAFLEAYQLSGGRLITMDNVEFSPSTAKTTLKLNFYAKDVTVSDISQVSLNKDMLTLIENAREKIQQQLDESTMSAAILYQGKSDPFSP